MEERRKTLKSAAYRLAVFINTDNLCASLAQMVPLALATKLKRATLLFCKKHGNAENRISFNNTI